MRAKTTKTTKRAGRALGARKPKSTLASRHLFRAVDGLRAALADALGIDYALEWDSVVGKAALLVEEVGNAVRRMRS